MRLSFYSGILHPNYNCEATVAWRCVVIVTSPQCEFSFLIRFPISSFHNSLLVLSFALFYGPPPNITAIGTEKYHCLPVTFVTRQ